MGNEVVRVTRIRYLSMNKCTETWSTLSSTCHRNGLHPLFNIYISMGAGRKNYL